MFDEDEIKEIVMSLLKRGKELCSKDDILICSIKMRGFYVAFANQMFSQMTDLGLLLCKESSSQDSRYDLRKFADLRGW